MDLIDLNCFLIKNTVKDGKKNMLLSQNLKGWNVLYIYLVKTHFGIPSFVLGILINLLRSKALEKYNSW